MLPRAPKNLDLICRVLVKETSDPNTSFTPYLTKKQKREAYRTRSKGAPSPPIR